MRSETDLCTEKQGTRCIIIRRVQDLKIDLEPLQTRSAMSFEGLGYKMVNYFVNS